MFIHRTHSNGLARYAVKTEDNKELASISIEDGRYPGYTFIPVIVDLNGENDGLIFLLNWMTVNIKSPLGISFVIGVWI
ncbi:hypothetical protein [Metabacillus fastidiosus]|uniref:Uncharacterized protein n=1 Tax=Metabacillus fastidiosus TaxID=1458 RepID=A0ABU6NVM6_9BACI|nr:hypothetical protein [Metabacillus fastidiosus]